MSTSVAEIEAAVSVEGIDKATGELTTFSKKVDDAGAAQGKAAQQSQQHTESLRAMSTTAAVAGTSLLGALGLGLHAAEGLGSALAPIGTLLGANSAAATELTGKMKDLIASSPQSADEIGMSAYTILSAGIQGTTNVMNTLRASQRLSEAGLGSMADATDLVTSAMNAFKGENLSADAAAKILFGTISLGKTTTSGLAQGFGEVAPLAAAAGVSFHDLLAATAALTATGQTASIAYTGIRTALTNVIKPSSEAAAAAKQLGLDFSASNLQAVGFAKFLDQIKQATGGNVETMAKLFGSVEGVNAVLSLTGPQAQAFADNLKKIDDAGGKLNARANEMEHTLGATFAEIQNRVTVTMEKSLRPAIPLVEDLLNGVGDLADGFASLPTPVQTGAEALALLTGTGLLLFGMFSKLELAVNTAKGYLHGFGEEGSFADTASSALGDHLGALVRTAGGMAAFFAIAPQMRDLTGDMTTAGLAAGALSGALVGGLPGAAIGATLGGIAGALGILGDDTHHATDEVLKLGSAFDQLGSAQAAKKFFDTLGNSAGDIAGAFRITKTSMDDLSRSEGGWLNAQQAMKGATNDVKEFQHAFGALAAENPSAAQKVLDGIQAIHGEGGKPIIPESVITDLTDRLNRGQAAFSSHAKHTKEASDANNTFAGTAPAVAGSMTSVADSFKDADQKASDYKTTLDHLLGIGIDVESTNLRWSDALANVTKSLTDNGATLDLSTDKGRQNREAIVAATQAALAHASAVYNQTGSLTEANRILGVHIQDLGTAAEQAGLSGDAILGYIEDVLGIPAEARTNVHNTADVAAYEAQQLINKYGEIPPTKNTTMTADTSQAENALLQLRRSLLAFSGSIIGDRGDGAYYDGSNSGTGAPPPGNDNGTYDGNYAEGGVIPARAGGTLIRVGEAGHDEIVIPTDDDARAMQLIREGGLAGLLGDRTGYAGLAAPPGGSGASVTYINVPVAVHGSLIHQSRLDRTIAGSIRRTVRDNGSIED